MREKLKDRCIVLLQNRTCTLEWEEPFLCKVTFRSAFCYETIKEFALFISETNQCVVDYGFEHMTYGTHMEFNEFIKTVTRQKTDVFDHQPGVIRLARYVLEQYEVEYSEMSVPFRVSGAGHSFSFVVNTDETVLLSEGLYATPEEFMGSHPNTHHYMDFIGTMKRCFEPLLRQPMPDASGPIDIHYD